MQDYIDWFRLPPDLRKRALAVARRELDAEKKADEDRINQALKGNPFAIQEVLHG